jgi:hypothetical protein
VSCRSRCVSFESTSTFQEDDINFEAPLKLSSPPSFTGLISKISPQRHFHHDGKHRFRTLETAVALATSSLSSPRNLEGPWYAVWQIILVAAAINLHQISSPQWPFFALATPADSDDNSDGGIETENGMVVDESDLDNGTDQEPFLGDISGVTVHPGLNAKINIQGFYSPREQYFYNSKLIPYGVHAIIEIKASPSRRLTGPELACTVMLNLKDAQDDLLIQAQWVFHRAPEQTSVHALAVASNYWLHGFIERNVHEWH